MVKEKSPALLVIDTVDYFVNELMHFGELVKSLGGIKILFVAGAVIPDGIDLESVHHQWCITQPFDPMLVVSKAGELLNQQLNPQKKTEEAEKTYESTTLSEESTLFAEDRLQADLKRFLNIK
ncbi:MAG: hypothetical protein HQK89_03315 [Nitrospirae bacterium]|nr:hypothetical protein [Nitrospirota bacterium]